MRAILVEHLVHTKILTFLGFFSREFCLPSLFVLYFENGIEKLFENHVVTLYKLNGKHKLKMMLTLQKLHYKVLKRTLE